MAVGRAKLDITLPVADDNSLDVVKKLGTTRRVRSPLRISFVLDLHAFESVDELHAVSNRVEGEKGLSYVREMSLMQAPAAYSRQRIQPTEDGIPEL